MHLDIDTGSGVPLHKQVYDGVLSVVRSGRFGPGDRLFTETELSRENSISLAPVRQAIGALVAEGFLERQRAKGVFIPLKPSSNTNRRLTLVVPDVAHSFFGSMVAGIEKFARGHGYDMVVSHTDFSPEREDNLLRQLRDAAPHVVLLCTVNGGEKNRKDLSRLAASGFTVVMVDGHFDGLNVDVVENDNVQIGLDATNYLLASGHKRITFLATTDESEINAVSRRQGYEQAMAKAGLTSDVQHLLHAGDGWHEDTKSAARNWLEAARGQQRPTAVFVLNDTYAAAVINAMDELGISVPKDMSVIGCADLDFARLLSRPLTTIDQDSYGMGAKAAELGIERFEGRASGPVKLIHPHKLVERETCCKLTDKPRKARGKVQAAGK